MTNLLTAIKNLSVKVLLTQISYNISFKPQFYKQYLITTVEP